MRRWAQALALGTAGLGLSACGLILDLDPADLWHTRPKPPVPDAAGDGGPDADADRPDADATADADAQADADASDGGDCIIPVMQGTVSCPAHLCSGQPDATPDVSQCASPTCEPGWHDCDGDPSNGCESQLKDLTNCGACNQACAAPDHTMVSCESGQCMVTGCGPGFADCDQALANGCETPLNTLTDCGACGQRCELPHTSASCQSGMCVPGPCEAGWGDCDGTPANGCESSLATQSNCGSCGAVCALKDAAADCVNSMCIVRTCHPGSKDCDGDPSNGCERDVWSAANCGECNLACDASIALCQSLPGAPAQCVAVCDPGTAQCDGAKACVDLGSNHKHCGACGKGCEFFQAQSECKAEVCNLGPCNPGWDNCDGDPANGCETALTGKENCGACGNPCQPVHAMGSCDTGTCTILQCDPGWADCDGNVANGCETKLGTLDHCGECNVACMAANATSKCEGGHCVIDTCSPGFGNCDQNPATGCMMVLGTDLNHCGGCNQRCEFANGVAECKDASCQLTSCAMGYDNCDQSPDNGCEVDLGTNVAHCGACNAACELPNAVPHCEGGHCVIGIGDCKPGWNDCDGNPANGCETPLTDPNHCGTCNNSCEAPHATTECVAAGNAARCEMTGCDQGWSDCNGRRMDGCETNIMTTQDCGSCGNVCPEQPNKVVQCINGRCDYSTCQTGFANCNGNPDTCEPLNSLTDCGTCNSPCSLPHANTSCGTGSCVLVNCKPGWDDCDGNPANGCETNVRTLTDCGACGVACALPNATASCASGNCQVGTCNPHWGDCNASPGDGCERPLDTLTDCGACGQPCQLPGAATTSCQAGTCQVGMCQTGMADCDRNPVNGCETDLLSDPAHCGTCGSSCALPNANTACTAGMCFITGCVTGFGDCDANPSNGCEVNLNTDAQNCGGCGASCDVLNAMTSCEMGTCQIKGCNPGFGDCDGVATNGCEVHLNRHETTMCPGVDAPCGDSCNARHCFTEGSIFERCVRGPSGTSECQICM